MARLPSQPSQSWVRRPWLRSNDVPDETWYLGLGVTAAHKVIADLKNYLTK